LLNIWHGKPQRLSSLVEAVCHCLDCKRASGGEAATFFGVPEEDFTLISGELKAFYYIAQSGKGLDRKDGVW